MATPKQRALTGQTSYHAGSAAEEAVAGNYQDRGYLIEEHRWRGAGGEIDLIAKDESRVVFIEVKKSRSFAAAATRINARQMGRIYASAEEYLGRQPMGSLTEARFDVALVDAHGAIHIIENAFGAA